MFDARLHELKMQEALGPRRVIVRRPTPSDAASLAMLFSEMQTHYGCPVPDEKALQAGRLACKPVATEFDPRVLIAVLDDVIIGSIVLNVTFPAFELSQSLYIRDLYVSHRIRRSGIGQKLVRAAARLAFQEGFCALDWTTDTANSAARKMYESCGANALTRTYYRLTPQDISSEL
ncbi:GNAT family N-acetyltransferase [Rhodopila sp.]|uniref:GNAT family N-acetyltransferase n=1 Tax=Rhodopila sp. TaxID=2480087 RepID=UPI003D10904B